mgnify:CR=1 FL=1
MNYISTRDKSVKVTAAMAISQGISNEGGLFVPDTFKMLEKSDFEKLCSLDYIGRANYILSTFLNDFTAEEVEYCVKGAYTGSFDNEQPAPISLIGKNANILELWHGPTCAFKDLALQLLPYLLTTSAKKVNSGKKTVILVATSGDTGKAALEAFANVFDELTGVLGLVYNRKTDNLDSEIEELIEKRTQARKAKDFKTADQIRDQLKEMGIILEDTAQGVKWSRI